MKTISVQLDVPDMLESVMLVWKLSATDRQILVAMLAALMTAKSRPDTAPWPIALKRSTLDRMADALDSAAGLDFVAAVADAAIVAMLDSMGGEDQA